jgi:Uncharacterized protein conserved in bacteria (DUF2252)
LIVRWGVRDADPRRSTRAARALALAAVGAVAAVVAVAACPACSSAPRPPASHDAASSLQLDLPALRRRGFSEPLIHQLARSRFRYFRMLGEPFELRTCEAFREVLPSLPITVVQGDAHLEQFVVTGGGYGLEDFDRAGFGPAVVDLVRYAASLHVACADLPWRCDGAAAVQRFLSAYRADLVDATPPPPAPAIVARLRAKAPTSRVRWLSTVDALIRPLPAALEAEARRGWLPFARAMRAQHPQLGEGALEIVRLGALHLGFGSALERKLLFRLAGATAAPQDDLVVEARSGMAPATSGCIARGAPGEKWTWTFTAILGRRMPELHGYAVLPSFGSLWLQSWDPGYVELSALDVASQAELEELAVDAAHQLTRVAAAHLPPALVRYQRYVLRQAFDETRPRLTALARALAEESNRGWARLRAALLP